MQTALVCLCLLSTVLSTPVPPPLSGRAAGNCVGQHRILLKGCNAKHGFYIFKYVYSFSTRRNQTQIKKEEANSQTTVPGHRLDEDNGKLGPTEDGVAPGQDDNADEMENGISFKPENHSTLDIGGDAQGARPGAGTRAHGGVSVAVPTLASSEGSGDLDLMVEVDGDVSILPQGRRPGEAVVGNRSGVRSEDRDEGAPGRASVEGAMTAGRGRAPATGGDGDEGSGKATISGQGQEGVMWGTGTRGTALASVTEKMEDIQVNTEGVGEYTYIPDSSSVTVTSGKAGSTARATSFTQISPDKDDEVKIFIGRANIHLGEQETTQAGATVGSKDDGIPTVGTSSPLPRLGITVARDGSDDEGIPARRPPERPATTATPSHGDSVTTSPGDGHPTGDNEDGATTVGDGDGPVAPGPWRVTDGDVTIPAGAGIHENGDGEVKGEGQRFEEMPGRLAVTTTRQGSNEEATAAVPAKGASIRLATTVAIPGVSEGDCTTALGTAGGPGESTVVGRGGSGETGPATPQPRGEGRPQPRGEGRPQPHGEGRPQPKGEGRPQPGAKLRPEAPGLEKTPRMDKMLSPRGKASSQVSSGTQVKAGGHGSDAGDRPRAGKAMGSGEGQEQGQGGGAGAVGTGGGRLPGRHGRRSGARGPGALAVLGHSRQMDQVKRADELHVRERAFYSLGGARDGPRRPYASLGSADSSQSSEGEQGSRSDSRQTGLQPSAWGAPGHPYGRWSRGAR